ncbi:MAG: NAD(P)/FAD-dependent oxidoreductase [Christensenella sp.]|nr:NAD(P)/FAD-dependent oxidoreductase [Christensenella sp.]
MREQYDVVVVGSGAAGLTAAAYSAKAGMSTLVCERWHKTGGLVESFTHEGFTFDAGIRAFEDSGVITPMLRSLGIEMEFVKNPVSVGIGEHWVRLSGGESLVSYANLYQSIFPAHAEEIDAIMREISNVMRYMDVLYGIENPLFLESELKDPRYLTKTLLPWLVRYSSNIKKAGRLNEPVRDYLKKFTTSEPLIDMICQHFFAETPTFFALSYFGLHLDYRYPVGGTAVLPQKLTEYITARGGEVLLQAEVVHVLQDKHAIQLADGRVIRYRQLIWAGDQTALYRALGDPIHESIRKQKALVEQSHGIDSVMTLFIGSSIPPEEVARICGAHAFYTPKTAGLSALSDWRSFQPDGIDALLQWVVDYLENTTYEISIPALRDSSLAPEGKTGLVVSTLFDYDLSLFLQEAGSYEALKSLVTKTVLRVLSSSALPGLAERAERVLCSTPLTVERETASRHGAITGWAHTNHPMPAIHQFTQIKKAVLTPIQDILQCGMWTFSPAGLPVSIITGKLAADAAFRHLRKKKGNA